MVNRADGQWTRWCRDFDAAHQDILRLFHNRYVWLTINGMLEHTAGEIGFNAIVQNWLTTLYAHAQCTGIRRESDSDARTSSLERCLVRLSENPAMATRTRYADGLSKRPDMRPEYYQGLVGRFDEFATSPGAEELDADKVKADLVALRGAADTTRNYTNKIVAHREVVTDAQITLRWDELDQALNKVGEVLKRYYKLRHPGQLLGNLTPELPVGWEKPFRSAWCPPDFWPGPVTAADSHVHRVDENKASA